MIDFVLYTPLLVFVIFFTIQVAFLFLGNQAAGAAAREAARVARAAAGGTGGAAGGSPDALADGVVRGQAYATSVGSGVLLNPQVVVVVVAGPGGPQIQATVTGRGVQLVPGMPGANIRQVVQGPIEQFRPDAGV